MLPVRDFFSEQLQQHQASLRRTEAVVADRFRRGLPSPRAIRASLFSQHPLPDPIGSSSRRTRPGRLRKPGPPSTTATGQKRV